MIVYRITLTQFSDTLIASGNPARWNSRYIKVIYTAESRALACLENVVHRNSFGLKELFRTILIEVPDNIKMTTVSKSDLSPHWNAFEHMPLTQAIGDEWIKNNKTAILKVPSAIVPEEHNYLLNPNHKDYAKIKYLRSEPFEFDSRLQK